MLLFTTSMIRLSKRICSFPFITLLIGLSFSTLGKSERIHPCPGNPASAGYLSVKDIMQDVEDEKIRIEKGGNQLPRYDYAICPNTTLTFKGIDKPIELAFDEIFITCGIFGFDSGCEFNGGDIQFLVKEYFLVSEASARNNVSVSFQGITFTGFSKTAIAIIGAKDLVSAAIENCVFMNFQSHLVISMSNPSEQNDGPWVEMSNVLMKNGIGRVGISNDGGYLKVNNLEMIDMNLVTGIAGAHQSITSLSHLLVSNCDLKMVTAMYSMALLVVRKSEILRNTISKTGFYFNGPKTADALKPSAILNVTLGNNNVSSSQGWIGVQVEGGVVVNIIDSRFKNNLNMVTACVASDTSEIKLLRTHFIENEGTENESSTFRSLALATGDAKLDIHSNIFRSNNKYDAILFLIFRSSISMEQSCIIGGSSEELMFVSHDSEHHGLKASTNYVYNHTGKVCNHFFFEEDIGSSCYQGGICTGSCYEFATAYTCGAEYNTMDSSRQAPLPSSPVAPVVTTSPSVISPIAITSNNTFTPSLGNNTFSQTTSPVALSTVNSTAAGSPVVPSNGNDTSVTTTSPVAALSANATNGTSVENETFAPAFSPVTIPPVNNITSSSPVAPSNANETFVPVSSPTAPSTTNSTDGPVSAPIFNGTDAPSSSNVSFVPVTSVIPSISPVIPSSLAPIGTPTLSSTEPSVGENSTSSPNGGPTVPSTKNFTFAPAATSFSPSQSPPTAANVTSSPISANFSSRVTPCPTSPDISGYTTVVAISLDIQDEAKRIESGADPAPPYNYTLCPDTELSFIDETIIPLLEESVFRCGPDGQDSGCVISGGAIQFLISEEYVVPTSSRPNMTVSFQAISFKGFSDTSVVIRGSQKTTVIFEACSFTSFESNSMVNISNPFSTDDSEGNGPAISMRSIIVTEGKAETGISIDRGFVVIDDLNLYDVEMKTGVLSSNGAITFLTNLLVANSSLDMVTGTYSKALLYIQEGEIIENKKLVDVFFYSGPSTDGFDNSDIVNVTVSDNRIEDIGWTSVFAGSGVDVTVKDCLFLNNLNMETGVTASETSTIKLQGSKFINNVGTAPNVSALALAISDSSLEITETSFEDNLNYTSQIFSIYRSSISMDSICIIGGASDTVIFVSQDSTFDGVNAETIFLVDHSSFACNDTGSNRLFFEDVGAKCFDDGSCTGTCREVASSQFCLINNATLPPSAASITPSSLGPSATSASPATVPPSDGSIRPATLAPSRAPSDLSIEPNAPVAPVPNTSAPIFSPVDGTSVPATLIPISTSVAPITSQPKPTISSMPSASSSEAPLTIPPGGSTNAPLNIAPVIVSSAPVTIVPVTTAPMTTVPSETSATTAPMSSSESPVTSAPVRATGAPVSVTPSYAIVEPVTGSPEGGSAPPLSSPEPNTNAPSSSSPTNNPTTLDRSSPPTKSLSNSPSQSVVPVEAPICDTRGKMVRQFWGKKKGKKGGKKGKKGKKGGKKGKKRGKKGKAEGKKKGGKKGRGKKGKGRRKEEYEDDECDSEDNMIEEERSNPTSDQNGMTYGNDQQQNNQGGFEEPVPKTVFETLTEILNSDRSASTREFGPLKIHHLRDKNS